MIEEDMVFAYYMLGLFIIMATTCIITYICCIIKEKIIERHYKILDKNQCYVDYLDTQKELYSNLDNKTEYARKLREDIKDLEKMAEHHILYNVEVQQQIKIDYENKTKELEKMIKDIETIENDIKINNDYILKYAQITKNKKLKRVLKYEGIE